MVKTVQDRTKAEAQLHGQLEAYLYDYACDRITAKQVQKWFKLAGWSVNLRKPIHNQFECINPNGDYVWLSY
jgi:hypothetical protein